MAAFALGSIYGLGTLYIIALNGIMIGGAFALAARYGLDGRLFEFVAAHGFVELTIIFVAGAIGFSIGEAIARPAHRTRSAAFQRAVSRGLKLMLPCVVFLIGAGLIEGYVSPNPVFPLASRLAIGIGFWLLLLWTLSGFGRRSSAARNGEVPFLKMLRSLRPAAASSTVDTAPARGVPTSPPD